MSTNFTVSLSNIINELSLDIAFMPRDPEKILLESKDVNRPGLELTGFLDHFDNKRIQIIGNIESSFLEGFSSKERYNTIKNFFIKKPPAIIIARGIEPFKEMLELARLYEIPILRTTEPTSSIEADLVIYLSSELAPRVTRHGVFVEVYGEGIFLMGDSGVGKSEVAIELIKRGHRLIADDAVEIKRTTKNNLVGRAPENIRHFIEVRGIGIINARRIFGMGAVKLISNIDLVVNLEIWDDSKAYDRMGIETEYIDILGIDVPFVTIPVKPGRNLAVIIEVAAMNARQKKMGYNAAQELLSSIGMGYDEDQVNDEGNQDKKYL